MSKMTKCKTCGKDIAKGVKKCPHCGKDQRNWFMRHKIITAILIIILIAILGSSCGNKKNSSPSNVGSTPTTQTTFKVGDVIKTDKFEITITSVAEKSKVGNQYIEKSPAQGGTYVTVQWQYKNITDKPIGSFSVPQIHLVDKKGTEYNADIDASSTFKTASNLEEKFVSDINPGITIKTADVFEVSKDAFKQGGWKLLIKADGKDINVGVN